VKINLNHDDLGYLQQLETTALITTTPYVISPNIDWLIVNSASATSVTMPAAKAGRHVRVTNISTGTVTINAASGDTIDGAASTTIASRWTTKEFKDASVVGQKWLTI